MSGFSQIYTCADYYFWLFCCDQSSAVIEAIIQFSGGRTGRTRVIKAPLANDSPLWHMFGAQGFESVTLRSRTTALDGDVAERLKAAVC
jgi:hypothetical protein